MVSRVCVRTFGGVHCVQFALLAIAGNPDKTPLLAFLARFGGGLRFKGINLSCLRSLWLCVPCFCVLPYYIFSVAKVKSVQCYPLVCAILPLENNLRGKRSQIHISCNLRRLSAIPSLRLVSVYYRHTVATVSARARVIVCFLCVRPDPSYSARGRGAGGYGICCICYLLCIGFAVYTVIFALPAMSAILSDCFRVPAGDPLFWSTFFAGWARSVLTE